jgi:hypothetical protein
LRGSGSPRTLAQTRAQAVFPVLPAPAKWTPPASAPAKSSRDAAKAKDAEKINRELPAHSAATASRQPSHVPAWDRLRAVALSDWKMTISSPAPMARSGRTKAGPCQPARDTQRARPDTAQVCK